MEPILVESQSPVAPSRQIVEAFLDRMASGAINPGERLPSVRELAVVAMVNPNTVAKAYRDLGVMGVVDARSGSGVYVAESAPGIARAARRRATLDEFRRAAAGALRAGHDLERLLDVVRQLDHESAPAPARGGKP